MEAEPRAVSLPISPKDRLPASSVTDEFTQAVLNILEDFAIEKDRLNGSQKAVINILEDFTAEKDRLEATQKAVLNILDDFVSEKERLESTQKAILNILDDFESEKRKVEVVNLELRREVHERTTAEQASLEKGLALARSNSELEQFAYVASHDLQEPLRMVSSYVQLLAEKYQKQLDPQADKYIQYAVEGSKRMQNLISGLLEYSRTGREENSGYIQLSGALERAMINLQSSIIESGAQVTADPLPSVIADQTQLSQVFQNLISNAIKFAKSNQVPQIHVTAASKGKEWVISVIDQGIGVEPRHADRIFMIFQRLHTRTEYPGTGIGLAICKKVVERFGGRIWVESEFECGSKFCFSLPKAELR